MLLMDWLFACCLSLAAAGCAARRVHASGARDGGSDPGSLRNPSVP